LGKHKRLFPYFDNGSRCFRTFSAGPLGFRPVFISLDGSKDQLAGLYRISRREIELGGFAWPEGTVERHTDDFTGRIFLLLNLPSWFRLESRHGERGGKLDINSHGRNELF